MFPTIKYLQVQLENILNALHRVSQQVQDVT